jgi:hypothetical protein
LKSGKEVRAAFLALDAGNAACFRPSPAGRWLADLYELARRQLRGLGVSAVYGGEFARSASRSGFFPTAARIAPGEWRQFDLVGQSILKSSGRRVKPVTCGAPKIQGFHDDLILPIYRVFPPAPFTPASRRIRPPARW